MQGSSFKWRHSNSPRHRHPPRQAGPAAAAQQRIRAISAQNAVRKSRRKMSGFVHAAAIIRGVSVRSAANPSRQACRSIAVINAAGSRKIQSIPRSFARNAATPLTAATSGNHIWFTSNIIHLNHTGAGAPCLPPGAYVYSSGTYSPAFQILVTQSPGRVRPEGRTLAPWGKVGRGCARQTAII